MYVLNLIYDQITFIFDNVSFNFLVVIVLFICLIGLYYLKRNRISNYKKRDIILNDINKINKIYNNILDEKEIKKNEKIMKEQEKIMKEQEKKMKEQEKIMKEQNNTDKFKYKNENLNNYFENNLILLTPNDNNSDNNKTDNSLIGYKKGSKKKTKNISVSLPSTPAKNDYKSLVIDDPFKDYFNKKY